jgi:hypothetical protein
VKTPERRFEIAGQHRRGRGTLEDPAQHPSTGHKIRKPPPGLGLPCPHEVGQVAQARRCQGFQLLSKAGCQHGGGPVRTDRRDHRPPVDDGRRGEGRQLRPVDHIDQGAAGPGQREGCVQLRSVGKGDEHQVRRRQHVPVGPREADHRRR